MYNYDPTGIIASTVNGEVTKYVKDPHGNVVVTSRNGSIAGEYDYSAFGEQLTATDATNPFRYCGEYYDNENGLTYLRNRYYDSNTGRFLSEDPIKDGMNWYSYCGGDPVMNVDINGLYSTPVENLMLSILRLTDNKVNYQNYLADYYWGTSYAAPNYNALDREEYYDSKFAQIHMWANIERDKIRNDAFLAENPELKKFMNDILDLEGGGSIEQVSAAMYIVDYYCKNNNSLSYEELKDKYNDIVKDNTMYLYEFPSGEYQEEAKNTLYNWLRTKTPSITFKKYTYKNRKVIGVGIDVEQDPNTYYN